MFAQRFIPCWLVVVLLASLSACNVSSDEPASTKTVNFVQSQFDGLGKEATYRGAVLYNQWFTEANRPTEVNPLVPKTVQEAGIDPGESWRCVTCHGWDHKGVKAFSTGQLNEAASPSFRQDIEVFATIKVGFVNDNRHNFGALLNDDQIYDLTAYIRKELILPETFVRSDLTPYITVDSGKFVVAGNSVNGQYHYENQCQDCHGLTGDLENADLGLQNIKIGYTANVDPWKFVHITNYGPAELKAKQGFNQMKGVRKDGIFSPTEQSGAVVDILAYVRNSFPSTILGGNVARGARLYENWVGEKGASGLSPSNCNGLYTQLSGSDCTGTVTAEQSWLCKTCHGMDYKGINAEKMQSLEIRHTNNPETHDFQIIAYGFPGDVEQLHRFTCLTAGEPVVDCPEGVLNETDVRDLVAFLLQGVVDTDLYIFRTSLAMHGNPVTGQKLFYSTPVEGSAELGCAQCHPDTEVGNNAVALAANLKSRDTANLIRVFHRLRFGSVGGLAKKPAIRRGYTPQDVADVMAYLLFL